MAILTDKKKKTKYKKKEYNIDAIVANIEEYMGRIRDTTVLPITNRGKHGNKKKS